MPYLSGSCARITIERASWPWRSSCTDTLGHADFKLHARLPMTVLCAAPGFTAWVARDHVPDGPLDVRMRPVPNGGSLLIADRTGHLPGIQGRLNPILDNLDRTYLYADNVAINDRLPQPVRFNLNERVRLTDSIGARATLWFREILDSSWSSTIATMNDHERL